MFTYFSDLKDSLIAINGPDIDKAFNELVNEINNIENKINSILLETKGESLNFDDGLVNVKNNSIKTTNNFNLKYKLELDHILNSEEGILISKDNKFKTVKYSNGDYHLTLNDGAINPICAIYNENDLVEINNNNMSLYVKERLNLKKLNCEKIKQFLIKGAKEKCKVPTSSEEDIDFTKLSQNELTKIFNLELPDIAIKDHTISINSFKKNIETEFYKNSGKLDKYVKNNIFNIYDIFIFNGDKVKNIKSNNKFHPEQVQIQPNEYVTQFVHEKYNYIQQIVTLNLTYENFAKGVPPYCHFFRNVDSIDGKFLYNLCIYSGLIGKEKLSKELLDKLGLNVS